MLRNSKAESVHVGGAEMIRVDLSVGTGVKYAIGEVTSAIVGTREPVGLEYPSD